MPQQPEPEDFQETAQGTHQPGVIREFWAFLRHERKWWLAPIVLVLLIFGALVFLSGTGAAPFIYVFY